MGGFGILRLQLGGTLDVDGKVPTVDGDSDPRWPYIYHDTIICRAWVYTWTPQVCRITAFCGLVLEGLCHDFRHSWLPGSAYVHQCIGYTSTIPRHLVNEIMQDCLSSTVPGRA